MSKATQQHLLVQDVIPYLLIYILLSILVLRFLIFFLPQQVLKTARRVMLGQKYHPE